ncbi:RsmD family RNA methyltransferase [Anaplasma capra]|uniref:RsmD family RNA methyltransferase n=1 Tax=Anaplasma capra TaxID=1562740 RepID=UPI0021D5B841|nr:RsmD family RNA methyltransferase [Anaplasma capra]MCU7611268.1 RsmD family RNA methyltransferase [Anaplasma capra]MCU7612696.1 RsmD family RNA methyltransferase [Anaplasma capra]
MIRVTAGVYRGRRVFTGNALKARPVISVLRESVFNILRSRMLMEGISVCDLFCGSGAFAFEALSRGAEHACLVDIHLPNLQLVRRTAASLGVEHKLNILCCDIHKLPCADRRYDLAFVDPPYGETSLVGVSLGAMLDMRWCQAGSVVVLCIKRGAAVSIPERYEILSRRSYCGSEALFMCVLPE